MTFLANFLYNLFAIFSAPFVLLSEVATCIVSNTTAASVLVCVVASAVYLLACLFVSAFGWETTESGGQKAKSYDGSWYTTPVIRRATRSTGWDIAYFALKSLLVVAHIACYVALWAGRDLGLFLYSYTKAAAICAVVTLIGIALRVNPLKD